MSLAPLSRRHALIAGAGALAAPRLLRAAGSSTLRFMPQADLTVLDPLGTTAYPTRNHGHLCWDTLYGVDTEGGVWPQLAEGHVTEDGGRRWTFTLRQGPTFHDGTPVRAADAVASIRRWLPKDSFGQALSLRVDELVAIDDRRFTLRLNKPFGPLLDALAKATSYPCFIYPERFAAIDPAKPFTEVVGSGPYRFMAAERIPGALTVYQKFDGYVPAPRGPVSLTAGPKLARFERVEWRWIPDPATAAAALQAGEIDWFEDVPNDLAALLGKTRGVTLDEVNTSGTYAALRFNHLHPPFDDPAVRRAMLGAVAQADFMQSVAGETAKLWREGVGAFPVSSPLANSAGLDAMTRPRDMASARRAIEAAGKGGAPVLALHATDVSSQSSLMSVGVDMLTKLGFQVTDNTMDWGSLLQRRTNNSAPSAGGWNVLIALFAGAELNTPAGNALLRANGSDAWFGWPTSPRLEALRTGWFDEPNLPAQKSLAADLQQQFFVDVPYVPLGQWFSQSAYRTGLTDVRRGMVLSLNAHYA